MTMGKEARARSSRVWTRLSAPLRQQVSGYCAASGIAECSVFEAALRQYLDGTHDMALMMRRQDRLGRAMARMHRDQEVLSGAFVAFMRLWFAHTPNLPEEAREAAIASAEDRYKKFVEHVAERFSGGHRFLDDLPKEVIANDAELEAILAKDGPDIAEAHCSPP
jgi:hypothetical protein